MDCSCLNCRTPGFRFHPTDAELINCLRNKILGIETPGRNIAVIDGLGKMEPRELPGLTNKSSNEDWIWYFFWSPIYKKNGISRTAKNGFWKATGKVRKVRARGTKEEIGLKKTLVFYNGPGKITPWVIHEYHSTAPLPDHKKVKNFVLCKLKLKDDGMAEIFNPEETQSTTHFPSDFNVNNEEDQSVHHSHSNSIACNPSREESLSMVLPSNFKNDCSSIGEDEEVHNFPTDSQISVVGDATPKVTLEQLDEFDNQECESRNDLPSNLGSPVTADALPDDPVEVIELSAKRESADVCAEGFGPASPLQPLMQGDAMPACKETPFSYSFSGDNEIHNQSSNDETDENVWQSFLADFSEADMEDGSNQLNIVVDDQCCNVQCLDTVSTFPQRSSRKRLHDEGSRFCDEEPETSRAKVELQTQTNMPSAMGEDVRDLTWALRSFNQRHALALVDIVSYNGYGDEQQQMKEEGISVEDLFPSDGFGLQLEFFEPAVDSTEQTEQCGNSVFFGTG